MTSPIYSLTGSIIKLFQFIDHRHNFSTKMAPTSCVKFINYLLIAYFVLSRSYIGLKTVFLADKTNNNTMGKWSASSFRRRCYCAGRRVMEMWQMNGEWGLTFTERGVFKDPCSWICRLAMVPPSSVCYKSHIHCKLFWLINVNRALIDITQKRSSSDTAPDSSVDKYRLTVHFD